MWIQCLIGTAFIVLLEYGSGMVLNNVFSLGIWDYSQEFLNLHGQICLKNSILFFLITPFAFWLEDYVGSLLIARIGPPKLSYYYKTLFAGRKW